MKGFLSLSHEEIWATVNEMILRSALFHKFTRYTRFKVVRELGALILTVFVDGDKRRFFAESFEDLITEITGDSRFYKLRRKAFMADYLGVRRMNECN